MGKFQVMKRFQIRVIASILLILACAGFAESGKALVADHEAVNQWNAVPPDFIRGGALSRIYLFGPGMGAAILEGCRMLGLQDTRFRISGLESRAGDEGKSFPEIMPMPYPLDRESFDRFWDLLYTLNGTYAKLFWGLAYPPVTDLSSSDSIEGFLEDFRYHLESVGAPGTVFLVTVPVWSQDEKGLAQHLYNERLRMRIRNDEKSSLLDAAEILSWNDRGEQCRGTWTDASGIVYSFPVMHPENLEDLEGEQGNRNDGIGQKGALRLAKALWWLVARQSGWQGMLASITIKSPNGGEIWQVGNSYNITWTQSGLSGLLNIKLYKGNDLKQNIGSALATANSFIWVIPPIIEDGFDYKVKIYQDTIQDFSDYPFTIVSGTPVTHTVTFLAGTGGSIIGKTPQIIAHGGDSLPVTAVPGSGYHFVNWTGSGGFTPTSANPLTVKNVQMDMSITANFAPGTSTTYSISGRVTKSGSGLAGVIISGLPGNPTTDLSGNYSASVTSGWSGTAIPVLAGFTFSPSSRSYSKVTSNQTSQDYSAVSQGGQTHTISGRVTYSSSGLAGVTMKGLPGNPLTDSQGAYSAKVDHGWSGIVTPVLGGYVFTPGSMHYINVILDTQTNYLAEKRNPRVRFEARPGGRVEGNLDQQVVYGGSTTPVTAVADEGRDFLNWSDRGGFFSVMNPLVITDVERDMLVAANFSGGSPNNSMFYMFYPENGSTVWGPQALIAEAAEGVNVERAEFSVDDRRLNSTGRVREMAPVYKKNGSLGKRFFCDWDSTYETLGWHLLRVTGYAAGKAEYMDEIMVFVENVTLGLQAERREDRGFRVHRPYALLRVTVNNRGGEEISKYKIYRAEDTGAFAVLREIGPEEVKEGVYEYHDAFLEENKNYRYKIEAINNRGVLAGASDEVVI